MILSYQSNEISCLTRKSFPNSNTIPHSPQSLPENRGLNKSQQLDIFQRYLPDYEAVPYWSLDPVPPGESLPGQKYRLTLRHGSLSKAIPVQFYPDEGDRLLGLVEELDYDWRLDLDKTGQLASDESRSALNRLMEAALGGVA